MSDKIALGCCEFYKDKKYILACSFGPDSMALFDMLYKKKCNMIVCFVNYHKRKESDYEQTQLINYCQKKNICYEILDLKNTNVTGNFQKWARNIRYDFFSKTCHKYNALGVFVAQHEDDLIETYLMQKTHNSIPEYYGLKKYTTICDSNIIRPLLCYTKKTLLNYCQKFNIPFSIDTSNFNKKYLRNKIRHDIISDFSDNDRKKILQEIDKKNKKLDEIDAKIKSIIKLDDKRILINELLKLSKDEFYIALNKFIQHQINKYTPISYNFFNLIRNVCLCTKPNVVLKHKDFILFKEYDEITIKKQDDCYRQYSYVMKSPGKLFTKEIEIDFSNGSDDKNIFPDDYPITIRSPKPFDKLIIKNYSCFLKKIFIDWKMPLMLRKIWPVFCDKNNRIIYVPRYRKRGFKKDDRIKIKIL